MLYFLYLNAVSRRASERASESRVLFENVLWACLHLFFSIARFSSNMSAEIQLFIFHDCCNKTKQECSSECELLFLMAGARLLRLETSRRVVCAFNGYWGVKIIIYKKTWMRACVPPSLSAAPLGTSNILMSFLKRKKY